MANLELKIPTRNIKKPAEHGLSIRTSWAFDQDIMGFLLLRSSFARRTARGDLGRTHLEHDRHNLAV